MGAQGVRLRQRAHVVEVVGAEGSHRPVGTAAEDQVLAQRQRVGRAHLPRQRRWKSVRLVHLVRSHPILSGAASQNQGQPKAACVPECIPIGRPPKTHPVLVPLVRVVANPSLIPTDGGSGGGAPHTHTRAQHTRLRLYRLFKASRSWATIGGTDGGKTLSGRNIHHSLRKWEIIQS